MSNVVSIERLKSIVGKAAFDELIKQLPGKHLYIPKCYDPKYPDKKARNRLIRADYFEAKMDVPDLIAKYNLDRSTIYHIINEKGTK